MPKTHWNRVCVKYPLGLWLSHSGEWQAFHVSTSGAYWINILTSVSWGREGAEGQRLGFFINKHKQLIKAEWYRFVIHILKHWSILFADDTAIYVHGKDIGRIFNQRRDDLSKLKECFSCNRLTPIFFKLVTVSTMDQEGKYPECMTEWILVDTVFSPKNC